MVKALLSLLGFGLMVAGLIVGGAGRTVELGFSRPYDCGSPWFPRDASITQTTERACEEVMGDGAGLGWGLLVFGAAVLVGLMFMAAAQGRPAASAEQNNAAS